MGLCLGGTNRYWLSFFNWGFFLCFRRRNFWLSPSVLILFLRLIRLLFLWRTLILLLRQSRFLLLFELFSFLFSLGLGLSLLQQISISLLLNYLDFLFSRLRLSQFFPQLLQSLTQDFFLIWIPWVGATLAKPTRATLVVFFWVLNHCHYLFWLGNRLSRGFLRDLNVYFNRYYLRYDGLRFGQYRFRFLFGRGSAIWVDFVEQIFFCRSG